MLHTTPHLIEVSQPVTDEHIRVRLGAKPPNPSHRGTLQIEIKPSEIEQCVPVATLREWVLALSFALSIGHPKI